MEFNESVTSSVGSTRGRGNSRLWQLIAVVLVVVIGIMLFLWKPWNGTLSANARTVEVTGETTITDTPDEFLFFPLYSFTNPDKQTAYNEMTKKSDEIVAQLKKLGIPDNKIKTDSNGRDDSPISYQDTKDLTYTLQITVTATSKEQAQKVSDYLASTTPSGTVTPLGNFSDSKRKSLEAKARSEATKDARAKADEMAKNLGFKVGKVKSVSDAAGLGTYPYAADNLASGTELSTSSKSAAMPVQPGENKLPYAIKVTYFIR